MAEATPVQIFHMEEKRRQYRRSSFYLKISVVALFLLVPFLFPSFKTVDLAVQIIIFGALVASFDILLGYTGILSFGHGMFFGIGAYCMAFLLGKYGMPSYSNLALGFMVAAAASAILAMLISFLTLRVKAIFFAMITLAIAELAIVLFTKLSGLTGGEDGISFMTPGIFSVTFSMGTFMGVEITGKIITYYFILLSCLGLFLVMLRFTHSPLGRVLQAIRDNTQRAEALGNRTFVYQSISITFGCVMAAIIGGLYAMWMEYVNPESSLGVMDHYARCPSHGHHWRNGDALRRDHRRRLSENLPDISPRPSAPGKRSVSRCPASAQYPGAMASPFWNPLHPGGHLLPQGRYWVREGTDGTKEKCPVAVA